MGSFGREAMLKGLGQQSSTRGSRPLGWVEGPFQREHRRPTENRDMRMTGRNSGKVTLRKERLNWLHSGQSSPRREVEASGRSWRATGLGRTIEMGIQA